MTQGIEGFQRLLQIFRSASTWALAGLVAIPFVAGLAHLAPPWPAGVVATTAVLQLVILAIAYQVCQGCSRRATSWMMIVGLLLMLASSATYLQQLSQHSYQVPTTDERFAKGTECTDEARLVFAGQCPALGSDALRSAEYEAERLWTASSISSVRIRLVLLWSLAFAALAWTLGAFFVYQMGVTPMRRMRTNPLPRTPAMRVPVDKNAVTLSAGSEARTEVEDVRVPADEFLLEGAEIAIDMPTPSISEGETQWHCEDALDAADESASLETESAGRLPTASIGDDEVHWHCEDALGVVDGSSPLETGSDVDLPTASISNGGGRWQFEDAPGAANKSSPPESSVSEPTFSIGDGDVQWQSEELLELPSSPSAPAPLPPPAPSPMSAPSSKNGGGLLGGGLPGSDTFEAAEMAELISAEPALVESRWINAHIEDHAQDKALQVGQSYTLAFAIEAKALEQITPGFSVPSLVAAPQDKVDFMLTVQLNSEDFRIDDAQRPLRILASGLSAGRARFDVSPLRDGAGTITATFHKDGNFVQKMTLVLQVGGSAAPSPQASRAGRPLLASKTLRKRDAGISVEPAAAGGFDCTVWGSVQTRARLPIKDAELADAIEQLRRALMTVVMRKDTAGLHPFQDAIDVAPAECDAALVELAKAGYLLYRMLFHHPAADLQCKAIGDWLRKQALNANTMLTLQVIGDGFPVPWALLYMTDVWDETKVTWEGFLGMRHVIEQIPLQNEMSGADSLIEETTDGLAISLNLNTGIDAQMKLDVVQRQTNYWANIASKRPGTRITTRTQVAELLSALASTETDDQILYLYCHASARGLADPGGPNRSSLTLSDDQSVTLGDLNLMATTDRKLKGNPLVFINACESGELSPMFYNGFVPYFMSKGARGVIGTECKMPALFAAEWARAFFDELLAGKPLGEIFLNLRRRFLIDHCNPLGLLYGLHCDADVQLAGAATDVHS